MSTVLVIEDDVVLRDNVKELLELSNYNVITAANGKEGVSLAKKRLPDIIICDIMMPELDGYGVLQSLQRNRNTKFIPLIFLSAKTNHTDIRKGMNLGADDYITKPFLEDDLICAIESRIAKTAILKETRINKSQENIEETNINSSEICDLKDYFKIYGVKFSFEKNEIIYDEGNHANYFYLVSQGVVRCYKLDEQGKELTTEIYKEGDLFGFASITQFNYYDETAIALKNVKLFALSRINLYEILDNNHEFLFKLVQTLNDDLSKIKDRLMIMAYSTVNRKTAETILKFAEKINHKPSDLIKISRYDLASVAGIATETFIRSLTYLKKKGIIISEGRNIRILDIDRLRNII
jgi:DNA-binding response OmpR family regulator